MNFLNGLCAGIVPYFLLKMSHGDVVFLAGANSVMAVAAIIGAVVASAVNVKGFFLLSMALASGGAAVFGRLLVGLGAMGWLIVGGLAARAALIPFGAAMNQTIWLHKTPRQIVAQVFGTRRAVAQGPFPIAVVIGGVISSSVGSGDITTTMSVIFVVCGVGEILAVLWLSWRVDFGLHLNSSSRIQ